MNEDEEADAWVELQRELRPGESIEPIVFGGWGAGGDPPPGVTVIPSEKRGILLSPTDARPMMKGWSFHSQYTYEAYAMYAWTTRRVFFLNEYDGSTRLKYVPRSPVAEEPSMSGSSDD